MNSYLKAEVKGMSGLNHAVVVAVMMLEQHIEGVKEGDAYIVTVFQDGHFKGRYHTDKPEAGDTSWELAAIPV